MKSIIIVLLSILAIAAGASTRDDIKKQFENFERNQNLLRHETYDLYKGRGLLTFAEIVKANTLPVDVIATEKDKLYALPSTATVENNEELSRIANWITELRENFFIILNGVGISEALKFRALLIAIQEPDRETHPTADDQKQGVTAVIEAENPESGAVEKAYGNLYFMQGFLFIPSYRYIQARMGIIKEYYKRPEVSLSEEIIARIDEILADNKLANAEVKEYLELDTVDKATKMLEALPAYLKSNIDLLQVQKDAQIECNFVRCRSTKDDPPVNSTEKPTDKPNSALNKTSGLVFGTICATVWFFVFLS